jgi:hypothetical protein
MYTKASYCPDHAGVAPRRPSIIAAEAAQLRWTGGFYVGNPLIELGRTPLEDKDHKSLRQASTHGKLAAPRT